MRCIVFSVLLSWAFYGNAQSFKVFGTVADQSGAGMEYATVSLLTASDSSWVQSTVTNGKGDFSFPELTGGNFLLDVFLIGYERALIAAPLNEVLMITLTAKGRLLQEVTVKSNAPEIRTELGKTVVNFRQATVAGGSDVLDLLRRAPGVTVDGNGNISMNGKGVLITINEKQSYLSGNDLATYLRSLPAEQVAEIELMDQPSAKYDAEGNTGVINIKTRKLTSGGWNGSITSSYMQSAYPGTRHNASLNHKGAKLTFYSGAGYLLTTGFLNKEQHRYARNKAGIPVSDVYQKSFMKEIFSDYNVQAGFDYTASEKFSFNGSAGVTYHPNSEKDITEGIIKDHASGTVVQNRSVNENGLLRKHLNGSVWARYEPSKKHLISLDLNCLLWRQTKRQYLQSIQYDHYGQNVTDGLILNSRAPQEIDVYVAKADYNTSLSKGINLEAGIKSSFLTNRNQVLFNLYEDPVWVYDATRSNDYTYKENINAVYLSAGTKINKWQIKTGLRAEQTNIRLQQLVGSHESERNMFSVFPTAFISYQYNEHHRLELDYGRRVQRPSYRDLNPFMHYLSQYAVTSGNPRLLPQFGNALSVRHNYKNMLFTEATAGHTANMMNHVIIFDEVANTVLETLRNMAQKYNFHASAGIYRALYPWWNLTATYGYYFNEYRSDSNTFMASSHGHSISLGNEFNFKGWTVYGFYQYNSGDLQELTERSKPSHWMNFSVAKKMLKDTTTVKLSVEDPLSVYKYREHSQWKEVEMFTDMQFATRRLSLAFTYNFGARYHIKRSDTETEEVRRL